ncbi:MAG: sensor histidine kinase KdpD [Bdellovibrionales bacterium]|nr:sensor histidine kinase KdpD [Bdellovibrionales bacterium]
MTRNDDDARPNPDDLLRGVLRGEREEARGKLRVFFGMCPGVGKTYAMLRTAREARAAGVDVAIGVIEHHGREETKAMMAGFRVIAKRAIEYQGTRIEEMDLDRILDERPPLVLVDELAHTNAPGSRHPKRYQDVEELLRNGIDVYTTLNVQHVASRADLVYQITHVPVRETVPDSILEMANQIELIDLSTEELLKRLHEGKVYLGDRADRAAENFFKEEKLTALRELALRFTAEKVDDQLKRHMTEKRILGPWNTNERLLVAISHSPFSGRLIRATRRKAYTLEAPWIALHVDSGQPLGHDDQTMLAKNIELARELGAEVISTRDREVARAINRVVREKNVTQIVMGRPDRRFGDFFAGGTLLDQLLAESSEVDIHVLRHARRSAHRIRYDRMRARLTRIYETFDFFPYWTSAIFLGVVVCAGYGIEGWIGYRAVGYLFLASILLISFLTSLGPTLVSAALSAVAWNYLFIPPRFTFAINEPEDYMMCGAYFVVAITAGVLTSRIRAQERDLLVREKRAKILYDFSRALADANGEAQLAGRAAESIRGLFGISAAALLVGEDGQMLAERPCHLAEFVVDDRAYAVAAWSLKNRKRAGFGTETLASSGCLSIPLVGKKDAIGVLLLVRGEKVAPFTIEQDALLDTIASHLAIALERERFEKSARMTEVFEESEKLHQAILNSVSHELRTPLAAIVGAASALGDSRVLETPDSREAILEDLSQSAERLNRIVENLLDMSRISGGVLSIRKDLFDWTEALHSSLARLRRAMPGRRVEFTEGEEALVQGDHRLLEHVLMNLLANAHAYSPDSEPIEVFVGGRGGYAVLEVSDRGRGVPDEMKNKIFDRFFRIPGTPAGGTGLGLSIARSIVEAHGGEITVHDRSNGGGSTFRVRIPIWRRT